MLEIVTLKELRGSDLEWVCVTPLSMKHTYELRIGSRAIATLRREELFGERASAETQYGKFTFDLEGYMHPRAVMKDGTKSIASQERFSDEGGTIEFANGKSYKWVRMSPWGSDWALFTCEGIELVRYSNEEGVISRTKVSVADSALEQGELMQLIAFGWYLMTLQGTMK